MLQNLVGSLSRGVMLIITAKRGLRPERDGQKTRASGWPGVYKQKASFYWLQKFSVNWVKVEFM